MNAFDKHIANLLYEEYTRTDLMKMLNTLLDADESWNRLNRNDLIKLIYHIDGKHSCNIPHIPNPHKDDEKKRLAKFRKSCSRTRTGVTEPTGLEKDCKG